MTEKRPGNFDNYSEHTTRSYFHELGVIFRQHESMFVTSRTN